MDIKKSIGAFNELIEINNDRIEGYQTASGETTQADLKALFARFIQTSQKCKAELIDRVRKLGGTPKEGTRKTGKFFRVWKDVKAALTSNNRKVILNSCEFGEDAALHSYDRVIKNNLEYLSSEEQSDLRFQFMLIKAEHEKVERLMGSLQEVH